MKTDEKVFVEYFEANCFEDCYEQGEIGPCTSSWTNNDLRFVYAGFPSVADALKAICKANCFDYKPDSWTREFDNEASRFYFSTLVCDDNYEASEREIEEWKRGNRKLYACNIRAYLSVHCIRELTNDECARFNKVV